MVIKCW